MWVVDSEWFGLIWWNRSVAEFLLVRGVTLEVGLTSDGSEPGGMRAGDLRAFYERALATGAFQVEADWAGSRG